MNHNRTHQYRGLALATMLSWRAKSEKRTPTCTPSMPAVRQFRKARCFSLFIKLSVSEALRHRSPGHDRRPGRCHFKSSPLGAGAAVSPIGQMQLFQRASKSQGVKGSAPSTACHFSSYSPLSCFFNRSKGISSCTSFSPLHPALRSSTAWHVHQDLKGREYKRNQSSILHRGRAAPESLPSSQLYTEQWNPLQWT
jgi:hypothetical protein